MYKIEFNDFFTYSFSLDCVIFGFSKGKIHVLLIKRAMEPYKNNWAVPGDLVYPDEDLPDAAQRILFELTKLSHIELHQSQTFGNPKRHPQGRVITNAYFALIRIPDFSVEAASWAEAIQWTAVDELPELAFDHNQIVQEATEKLKLQIQLQPIVGELLPSKFTM